MNSPSCPRNGLLGRFALGLTNIYELLDKKLTTCTFYCPCFDGCPSGCDECPSSIGFNRKKISGFA